MDRAREAPKPGPLLGVLQRQVQVRIVNVSASGCLLGAAAALTVGSGCELKVDADGQTFTDDVVITRCVATDGAAFPYRVAVQFLWTRAPGPHSLRRLASLLGATADWAPITTPGMDPGTGGDR